MMRWLLAIVILAVASVSAYWVVRKYRPAGALSVLESQSMDMGKMKPPVGAVPVATQKAELAPFSASVTYSGRVVAQGDQDISARVTGRVEELAVYPGQRVIPGQLLVRLDSAELSAREGEAQASLLESQQQIGVQEAEWNSRQREQQAVATSLPIARNEVEEAGQMSRSARAKLVTVRAEFQRTDTLQREGGASLQELQQSQAQLAEATALYNSSLLRQQRAALSVRKAQSEVIASSSKAAGAGKLTDAARATAALRQAQLRSAEVQLGYTQILATAPAEVVERVVSPGTLVAPGQVLLRLKETGRLRLQADVPAEQAVRIRPGFPVKAQVLGHTVKSKVSSVFRSADSQTKTMIVEALVEGGPQLVPGASLTMEIALEAPQKRVSIPVAALLQDAEGKSFVWKLTGASGSAVVAYTCVMHPEIVRPGPGKCPKCGMDLVPQKRSGDTVAIRQRVETGSINGQRVAILKGLMQGEEVVVQGTEDLAEGMPAVKVPWGQDGPAQVPLPTSQPTMAPMEGMKH